MLELRKNTYRYHRLALDTFDKTPDQSQSTILDALRNVKKIWTVYPTSIFVISFFDAKANELVNVFSKAPLQTKREAFDILVAVDSKRNVYQKIMGN